MIKNLYNKYDFFIKTLIEGNSDVMNYYMNKMAFQQMRINNILRRLRQEVFALNAFGNTVLHLKGRSCWSGKLNRK